MAKVYTSTGKSFMSLLVFFGGIPSEINKKDAFEGHLIITISNRHFIS